VAAVPSGPNWTPPPTIPIKKKIKHGVLQGLILLPLLFLFYINDLPQLVNGKALPILFADDTSFIISNSDSLNMVQNIKVVLEITQKWFDSNRLLLNNNNNKTKFMQFLSNTSHQSLDTTEFNTYKINSTNSITFFGIIIESLSTLKEHIDYINSNLNSLGYMVHSFRSVLGLKILKQIYLYVHSVLNYGIMFWGNSPHTRCIFMTQKRIVRIIMKAKPKDSHKEMLSKLGILTLFNSYVCCKAYGFIYNKYGIA
jgi:hypothetical protein